MTSFLRAPVVAAFLLGVFLTLLVFVTAFFLGEATATRRGGILVAAAALSTLTPTPTETLTATPTPLPTDTPTPSPTSTRVPNTPTRTPIVPRCSDSKDWHVALSGWREASKEIRLTRGQSVQTSISVFGSDRSLEFSVVDQNGVDVVQRSIVGEDAVEFVAPYDDTFELRVSNPSLLSRKTVDLRWQVCGR